MNISWCVLLLLAWTQLARAYGTPNYIAMPEHWRVYNREQTAEQTATQSISRSSTARSGSLAAVDRTAAGPAQTVASQTIDWTALSRTGNSSGNSSKFDPPYTVCVGQWTPMTTCTADSTQDEYTGYTVELFRVLAAQIGWDKDDYVFSCNLGRGDFEEHLTDPNSNCTMTTEGLVLDPELLTSGQIKLTWPIYKTVLRIMVHSDFKTGSLFAFLYAFNWVVWMAIFLTAVGVGLTIAVLEWVSRLHKKPTPQDSERGWQTWLWYSLAKMVDIAPHTSDPASNAARCLFAAYAFLMLVMVSMYTAGSAGTLTQRRFDNPFPRGIADLKGRKVGTWSSWADGLQQEYGVKPVPLDWNDDADRDMMVQKLRDGEYDALIMDSPSLEYIAATNTECDLFIIGGPLKSFSVHLAFAQGIDDQVVHDFSQSIIMSETYYGGLGQFEQAYIKLGGQINDCILSSSAHGEGEQLGIQQVAGLWIVLAMCTLARFVLGFAQNIVQRCRNPVERAKAMRKIRASMITRRDDGSTPHAPPIAVPSSPLSVSMRYVGRVLALDSVQSSLDSFTQGAVRRHGGHGHDDAESPSKWRAFLGFTSSTGAEEPSYLAKH